MVRILAVLLIVGIYLFIPAMSFAATAQVIVITASPLLGNECVTDLGMEFSLPDEVSFWWTPATVTTGTKIVLTVGDWPQDCEDGMVVYEGNGSSTTQNIDTDDLVIGLYYHVYNLAMDGNCSACYATGSVIASDAIDTGVGGNVTLASSGLDDMADLMRMGLVLGFGVFFSLIGVLRASITGYIAGIIALILSTVYVWDAENIGVYIGVPIVIIIVGLMGSAIRNAWGEGLRVF